MAALPGSPPPPAPTRGRRDGPGDRLHAHGLTLSAEGSRHRHAPGDGAGAGAGNQSAMQRGEGVVGRPGAAAGVQKKSGFWTAALGPATPGPTPPPAGGDTVRVHFDPAAPPSGWTAVQKPGSATETAQVRRDSDPGVGGRFLLTYPDHPYPDGAAFQVTADRVTVHGGEALNPAELAWFLLGPVLSFLLAVRGAFVLHGSVVEMAGGAVAFCGPSGAGKSSLAAALARRGHRGVSDDLVVLAGRPPGPPWRVLPGVPRRLLWPGAARHLFPERDHGPDHRWEKRSVAGRRWVGPGPLPLRRLFYLAPGRAGEDAEIRPMAGHRAAAALLGNRRLGWLPGRGRGDDLDTVTRLVNDLGVDELRVPHDWSKLPDLVDRIEGHVAADGKAPMAEGDVVRGERPDGVEPSGGDTPAGGAGSGGPARPARGAGEQP